MLIICAQSCPHPHLDRATGLVALIALFRSVYCRVTVKLCTTIFLVFSLFFVLEVLFALLSKRRSVDI